MPADIRSIIVNSRTSTILKILSLRWAQGVPMIPLIVILGFIVVTVFAPLLVLHNPNKTHLDRILQPPFWESTGTLDYPFGTDELGRDIFSRIIIGARVSLIVAVSVIVLGGGVGTLIGLIGGYAGKRIDELLMRMSDAQLSIPMIFLAIALVGVLGASLQNIVFVIAFTAWPRYARIARAETLTLKQRSFVDLARVAGCNHLRIMRRHILPNILPSLIVLATLDVPKVILFEASLSFLGLGIMPPTPSWGGMISEGRGYISIAWWTTTFPGIVLMMVALSANILGDWLRDRLDPTLQI